MTDAMNLHNFPSRDDGAADGRRAHSRCADAAGAVARGDRPGRRGRRQRRRYRDRARRAAPSSPTIPIRRSPCPARSAARSRSRRPTLAARQRPQPRSHRRRSRRRHRRDRLPRRGRRGAADRQARSISAAASPRYPIPGSKAYPVDRRRSEADLRRRRARPYRDRHRLSDQGHARRALCRCDARQAFRAARLDRHRQIDRRRADPAPDLRHARPRAIS